jgi:hypothetical protein
MMFADAKNIEADLVSEFNSPPVDSESRDVRAVLPMPIVSLD